MSEQPPKKPLRYSKTALRKARAAVPQKAPAVQPSVGIEEQQWLLGSAPSEKPKQGDR
jgi:hypothetical protein